MGLRAQLEEGVCAQQGSSAEQSEPAVRRPSAASTCWGRSEVDVVDRLEGGAVVGGDSGGGVAWGGVGVGRGEGEGVREHSIGWGGCGRYGGTASTSSLSSWATHLHGCSGGCGSGCGHTGSCDIPELAVWPNIDMVWEQRNGNGTRWVLALEVASHLWCRVAGTVQRAGLNELQQWRERNTVQVPADEAGEKRG